MLILSRRVTESIIIDGVIKVKVLGIQGGQIKIGIEAPKEVVIMREEVLERIQQEKKLDRISHDYADHPFNTYKDRD